MDKSGWFFLCGCAPFTDLLFCAREREDLADGDIAASTFYLWDEQNPDPMTRWSIYDTVTSWRAQGMATIKPASSDRTTVAVGARGQFFEVEPKSLSQQEGKIATFSHNLRTLVSVEDVIFAAGLGRSVLRRDKVGAWTEIGPGVANEDLDRVVGFEQIDGFSVDDLYAAGWAGEIWHYDSGSWQRIDSPVNANLNAITCTSDGRVYAVGDNGTMVTGRNDIWSVVDTGRPENLQDVGEYQGEVFSVTDFRILKLTDEGLVPETRFDGGDLPTSCLSLWKSQDGLVSMGPKDLFRFSGTSWERIV
jgi:hypothetical protein